MLVTLAHNDVGILSNIFLANERKTIMQFHEQYVSTDLFDSSYQTFVPVSYKHPEKLFT